MRIQFALLQSQLAEFVCCRYGHALLSAWSASNEELISATPAPAPLLLPEPLHMPEAGFDALAETRTKGTQTMSSWQVRGGSSLTAMSI